MPGTTGNKVWSFIGWLAALTGSMLTILGIVGWLLKPHVDTYIINVHDAHEESKKDPTKIPFRDLLSNETGIPSDRIHIKFGEWYNSHLAFEKLVDDVSPILEEEKTCIIPRLIVMPNGRVKWRHTDGEVYDASIGQDGFHWFYHNHQWKPCKF